MKIRQIRLNDSYKGILDKGVLYDSLLADKMYGGEVYAVVVEGQFYYIDPECVDEVDEFEEEFSKLCEIVSDNNIFFGSHREHELGAGKFSVILENQSAQESYCIRKKDIPALILALLKLMEN